MAIAVCDHKLIAGLNFRLSSQRTLWTIQPHEAADPLAEGR